MTNIKQMYRQILIHPADRYYLKIFWRFNVQSPLDEYPLCTVTYCTSATPFQALRTIQVLARTENESCNFHVLYKATFILDIILNYTNVRKQM